MTALADERIGEIARVAHAAITEFQAQHGDPDPSLPGDLGDAEAHAVTLAGIRAIIGGATPEQLHETWVRTREAQGWKFGPRKDSRLKTHPCMVPYGKLPEHQRVKDAVFAAIVLEMTGGTAPGLPVSPDLACGLCGNGGLFAVGGVIGGTVPLPEVADVWAELAKVQRAAQTLGMVVERQARDLYAMWIDVSRGDLEAVKERVLNSIPDCDDNEPDQQWNGTETGDEWFDRTREES